MPMLLAMEPKHRQLGYRADAAIMAAFPLGLREIADISAEAQRRYGGVV